MFAKVDWFRVWAAQTNDSLRHAQAGRRQKSAYSPPEITSERFSAKSEIHQSFDHIYHRRPDGVVTAHPVSSPIYSGMPFTNQWNKKGTGF
jgi:hypothetical protein